jgi:hypothetical protein
MEVRCAETRELAAELALGVADAEERARALVHLADCPECRRRLEEISQVADELLMLAPHGEVPVGFEERALAPLFPKPPRRRRRLLQALVPAVAAAAAVAITLAVVDDDVRLASQYRDTLDEANGTKFEAYSLRGEGGVRAGEVFVYEGSPSWLLITVDPGHRESAEAAELVMDDGRRRRLGWFSLDPATGSSGGAVSVDLRRVSVVRLLPAEGGDPLVARLGDG